MKILQDPLPQSSPMSAGAFVPAPAAWFTLLRQYPELDPAAAAFAPTPLTVGRAAQLLAANQRVNAALRSRDDAAQDPWAVGGPAGDCEALASPHQPGRAAGT